MPRIIISEPGKTPQPYRLKTDRIVTKIGRGSENDILITTGSASTNHCKMKRVEGGFVLVDNNSTNGIKHEDTQYSIIDLKDGMTVQIGDDIDLEFTLDDEEKELLQLEDFEPQQKSSFPKSKQQPQQAPIEDDDDIILEEAKPRSKKSSSTRNDAIDEPVAPRKEKYSVKQSNAGLSFVIFMILAILFFVGGLAVRHYQEHKTFIFSK
ncbi:MAG: FHA domain-containing protein [Akkermansiaceae bacterium]